MSARLVEDTLGTLPLDETHGLFLTKLDLGYPAARVNSTDRVNANGAVDSTRFYSSRAVSLTVQVAGTSATSRRAALDLLRAYCSPARRPRLIFEAAGGERLVRLRGDQLGAPLTGMAVTAAQVAFVAPDGIIEAATRTAVTATISLAAEPGRSYPRPFPHVYPESPTVGTAVASNVGTEPAAMLARMWGPCSNPTLVNVTTGEQIAFTDLDLPADQYVEVDTATATVKLNGGGSVYGSLDLAGTSLFWLDPGASLLRYTAADFSPGARVEVFFRSAWI